MAIGGLKDFFAGVLTVVVSLIFVPVVFSFFVVIEWNFVFPLLQASEATDEGRRGHKNYGKHYMYYITYPFIVCINGVRYAYRSIRDALD